ncbi:MAG: hypothetical protein ACYDH4_09125 [Candidatus Cryosericum sp.]
MRRNREAYDFSEVSEEEIQKIEGEWNEWLASASGHLRSLDDDDVIERAAENARRAAERWEGRPHHRAAATTPGAETSRPQPAEALPGTSEASGLLAYESDEIGAWEFDEQCRVLIAEIPKAGNRWQQANVDAGTFLAFFNSQPGVSGQEMLVLREVQRDGRLGRIQQRPPVSVRSQNYRVELSIEGEVQYPDDGRPIGVFVRLSTRTFLYMVLLPSDAGHIALQRELDHHRARRDRVVRYSTDVQELRGLCPTLPLLEYLS